MKIPLNLIKSKTWSVCPLTSKDEKTILETQVITDDPKIQFANIIDLINEHTSVDIEGLPICYQIVVLYAVRECSFGSSLNVQFKCNGCKQISGGNLELTDLYDFRNFDDLSEEQKQLKLKPDVTIKDILDSKITDAYKLFLDIEVPKNLYEHRNLAIVSRKFLPVIKGSNPVKCVICGHQTKFNIITQKFAINSLSEHSITSLYQQINNMMYHGISLSDINTMLPFEREIHSSLLQQRNEQSMQLLEKKFSD